MKKLFKNRNYLKEFREHGKITNTHVLDLLEVAYEKNQEALEIIKYIKKNKEKFENE